MIQIPCKDLGYPEDNERITQTVEEVLGLLPSFFVIAIVVVRIRMLNIWSPVGITIWAVLKLAVFWQRYASVLL